ncbi:RrF2 family transcriptional regulator [Bradyrhizobium sp. STM 3562]|jgi:Rrf2 family protein|uniref:RrF2 family transcriptional regulator n=1 Tax=Bradyrhizobium sp. STM 3562 TaxID=578924 RepID=UPI00388F437F
MLTARGKYGLKAMLHLATLEMDKTAQASEIAKAHNIPKKFLDAILGDLRKAGLVISRKGPGGGYALARRPREIQVGAVIRVLDGPLAPIACASRTAFKPCRDCKDVKACAIRIVMTAARDALSDVLDTVTISDMVQPAKSSRRSPQAMARRLLLDLPSRST